MIPAYSTPDCYAEMGFQRPSESTGLFQQQSVLQYHVRMLQWPDYSDFPYPARIPSQYGKLLLQFSYGGSSADNYTDQYIL